MKYINVVYLGLKVCIALILLALCIVPIYYAIKWFKKNNKILKIYPKFEIVEVTNANAVDLDEAKEAIRISKEILEKIK